MFRRYFWDTILYVLFSDLSAIQYGFCTLFVCAFPLAPLLGYLNNLFEIRLDAMKLVKMRRRPVACRAGGIGIWYNVLLILSVLATLTNVSV